MALLGGSKFTSLGGSKTIQLNDKAGSDGVIIKDSDGFIVAKLDSSGNLQLKGRIKRTTTN